VSHPDAYDPDNGIFVHPAHTGTGTTITIQYASRHRGTVTLTADDVMGLIADLARQAVVALENRRADRIAERTP
jgi:hypothetical protein